MSIRLSTTCMYRASDSCALCRRKDDWYRLMSAAVSHCSGRWALIPSTVISNRNVDAGLSESPSILYLFISNPFSPPPSTSTSTSPSHSNPLFSLSCSSAQLPPPLRHQSHLSHHQSLQTQPLQSHQPSCPTCVSCEMPPSPKP